MVFLIKAETSPFTCLGIIGGKATRNYLATRKMENREYGILSLDFIIGHVTKGRREQAFERRRRRPSGKGGGVPSQGARDGDRILQTSGGCRSQRGNGGCRGSYCRLGARVPEPGVKLMR